MGEGQHRSGWPYARRSLAPLQTPDGILFDDYIEGTFFSPRHRGYEEPWIGVFHHPPRMPPWYTPERHLRAIFAGEAWQRSQPYLQLAICMTQYLADWLREQLPVPVVGVAHPMETPDLRFSPDRYLANRDKKIMQVGWFLRNTEAIHQLQAPSGFRKLQLTLPWEWVRRQAEVVCAYECGRGRPRHGGVTVMERIPDEQYDQLLAENVVFLEYYDVSASNTLVECVVRGTPLVVNRHPALEEYLGAAYPLFYDRFEDVPTLFGDDRILAGHRHLVQMDKSPFQGTCFRNGVAAAIQAVLPRRYIHGVRLSC
jgi:hypothetical protein